MLCLGAVGGATVVAPVTANAAIAQAPTIKVQGQVVDETGAPLMGASTKAKNSKTGTVTDMDGKFSLDVESNATLIVSYLGYKTSEVAVRGRAIIEKIQLTPDNNVLNQVVVVGYGTQKKADLTGSVAIVNAEEMKKVSNSTSQQCSKVRLRAFRLHRTVSLVPTRQYASAVSVRSAAQLLFT